MAEVEERDYFTDMTVLKDPYDFFEEIRAGGPIVKSKVRDMVYVTGFDEALEVLKNNADFSSVIAPQGPAVPLPFAVDTSDIGESIEKHRDEFQGGSMVVAYDGDSHARSRSLLNRIFSPKRLKENEDFILEYAEQLVSDAVARGGCELVNEIATPYVTLVIADLLGVPSEDRDLFREIIDAGPPPGNMERDAEEGQGHQVLEALGAHFYGYVTDRRENPRNDVLTDLATTTYPDGTLPDVIEVVKNATFLFGAGQDTTAKLIGNAMRFLCEDKSLQAALRANPDKIPAFVEESLRLEGSTKMTARLARRDTRIGDVEIPAGTRVFVALAAANRDPRRWDNPQHFDMDRPRLREHVAFGRGAHVCAGSPLARVETRVLLEQFLARTSDISFDEDKHGSADARRLDYEPSFIIRGLWELNLKLTPR